MKCDFLLFNGISLQIASAANGDSAYPTGRLQKGLVLVCEGQDLSEEAVGFGVPILKRGLQTIFPGEVELYPDKSGSPGKFTARYKLNLEEKIGRKDTGTINSRLVYATKNGLAALIRHQPIVRKLLTATSNLLRSTFSLKTSYEPDGFFTYVSLTYSLDAAAGTVLVELMGQEIIPDHISEIIIMNEQGAHHFDRYQEAEGVSTAADKIGCWDEVTSAIATFISTRQKVSFSLPQVHGTKLFRGRELIGTRLAWSGFGYTFPPNLDNFKYVITLKRLP